MSLTQREKILFQMVLALGQVAIATRRAILLTPDVNAETVKVLSEGDEHIEQFAKLMQDYWADG
jgi:hypothetical protein